VTFWKIYIMKTFTTIAFLVIAQLTFSHYVSVSQELSKNNPNGLDSYTEEEFKKIPKVIYVTHEI